MSMLPYPEMLIGNTVHALLLEMENDRHFLEKHSTMCIYYVFFLFLEIPFALSSVLSAVDSAIPAFLGEGG